MCAKSILAPAHGSRTLKIVNANHMLYDIDMERISLPYNPSHDNSPESADGPSEQQEKLVFVRLVTNVNQPAINRAVRNLLTSNEIPFVSSPHVDVPEPEVIVQARTSRTYYGMGQIESNVDNIRHSLDT